MMSWVSGCKNRAQEPSSQFRVAAEKGLHTYPVPQTDLSFSPLSKAPRWYRAAFVKLLTIGPRGRDEV